MVIYKKLCLVPTFVAVTCSSRPWSGFVLALVSHFALQLSLRLSMKYLACLIQKHLEVGLQGLKVTVSWET